MTTAFQIYCKAAILDWDGKDEVCSVLSPKVKFDNASSFRLDENFMERSKIIDEGILVDGTLVVELKLKNADKTRLPCKPFVPSNSCDKKMGGGTILCSSCNTTSMCARSFRTMDKVTPVPLSNTVEHHVFELLLRYVYGVKISIAVWKVYSRELIDAADQYLVSGLKLEAEAWYSKYTEITAQNAIDLLLYADAKNCALLKESVMDYFVKNGKDALQELSFEGIPESRSLFTDILLALSVKNEEQEEEGSDSESYRVMRISRLRRELDERDLDTDGSRETLIKRLELDDDDSEDDEDMDADEDTNDDGN
ncbi:hypothetical protein ACHAXR_009856 [Thalassiosira sp. AJA248-18]